MKKLLYIAIAYLLVCAAPALVSAKIIYPAGPNSDIGLGGFGGNGGNGGNGLIDINGDGREDLFNDSLQKDVIVSGKPDAKRISKISESYTVVTEVHNPLTGAVVMKFQRATHHLTYHQPQWGGNWTMGGGGLFSVGAKRYAVDLMGVNQWGAVPMLAGSRYIDAALSVIIFDARTGKIARQFTIASNPRWSLDTFQSHFVDVKGTTFFMEAYQKRPAKAPAPGKKTQITHDVRLIKVWNATHTKLIKQYYTKTTGVYVSR